MESAQSLPGKCSLEGLFQMCKGSKVFLPKYLSHLESLLQLPVQEEKAARCLLVNSKRKKIRSLEIHTLLSALPQLHPLEAHMGQDQFGPID